MVLLLDGSDIIIAAASSLIHFWECCVVLTVTFTFTVAPGTCTTDTTVIHGDVGMSLLLMLV
jgi:hypothetical protein